MIFEIVSVSIALIAIIVSIWLGLRNQGLGRRGPELQGRLVELEEARENKRKKATLQARIVQDELMITNEGESEARNIVLKLDGKPFENHFVSQGNVWPAEIIGAHSEATMQLFTCDECTPPWELEISWEDDSGEPGHYRTILTS